MMYFKLAFSLTLLSSALTGVMGTLTRENILHIRAQFDTNKDLIVQYAASLETLVDCPKDLKDAKIEVVSATSRYMKPALGPDGNPTMTQATCTDPNELNQVGIQYAIEGYNCGIIRTTIYFNHAARTYRFQAMKYEPPASYHGKNVNYPINLDSSVLKFTPQEAYEEVKERLREMKGGFKKMDLVMMNWLDVEILLFEWDDKGPVPVYRFWEPENDPKSIVFFNANNGQVVSRQPGQTNVVGKRK